VQSSGIIDTLSLPALYLITAVLILISSELGWRLGNYRRRLPEHEREAPIGAVIGAMLGLLAFLLAFTFGMAASRYDDRKSLVLEEANAISTAYLRAEMLAEPARSEIRKLLRTYAEMRVEGVTALMVPEMRVKTTAIHKQLWTLTVATTAANPESELGGLFVDSLNTVIDLDETRVTAGRNRIPDSIWVVLFSIAVLTMAAMGYQFGLTGERSWPVTVLLALVFTAVIVLIADLDRPQVGFLQVSQQALVDLIDSIGTPTP
jgi:hypothetical protein